ncbi:Phosphate transport system permease protein [Candidatus Desulfarcum epimagneticum]|uniref:Phosphate transport system permease protein n=1 Tax=uncultured Desulfobacteraceae bacterium TaxID=218296 RepID=A0A484HMP3_9BACT|nr:Phosphate transport system permease protein [uncultured Desulfobacteraceae bacterium]
MSIQFILITLLILTLFGRWAGRRRALKVAGDLKTHSRPSYHGAFVALGCGLPALLILGVWIMMESGVIAHLVVAGLPDHIQSLPEEDLSLFMNDVRHIMEGDIAGEGLPLEAAAAARYAHLKGIGRAALLILILCVSMAGIALALRRISPDFRARNRVERIGRIALMICSAAAVFITLGIAVSVLWEAIRFFKAVPFFEFIFGTEWSPQMAIREDQAGSSGAFGAVPVFAGTLLVAFLAMMVAAPVGLMSAIYLSEYAGKKVRAVVKPLMEILAGIPTVVYGYFAALIVAPLIRDLGTAAGLDVSSESALAAGLTMGVMIIPFVSSLSDDVINAVPQSLRDGSYALGATRSETARRVLLPAALPGIAGGMLLAVSRAIGETMIVVMAAGLSANLTLNPLKSVTTVTVQIATLLVGDQEFDSPKTLAAFALGLSLFVITMILNVIALYVTRKYREQYE